ncbi:hypothetical protein [Streptomyces nymphaeiformis]|uniref:Multidrug efflux pump subunit AcrA (Membrane-fusion protein) n=1 Tax=Streptomyces nymphaeiformis TaxID=2663842 RepID=A0A7W7TXB0_9ACTN|nr:hypothetical protein [Streptomyces nymphaeiformis]MBB4981085.1 multidrug efflux pump subunit AcrA (membrane-fusion protein) [Streptomyces nymphaeiformis]
MSNLVGGLLAATVLGAGYALYWLTLYPCRLTELKFAFRPEYAPHRQALKAAREQLRRVRENRAEEASGPARRRKEILGARNREVGKREAEISRLGREEEGEVVGRLGALRLHEHALVFLAVKESREEQEATTEVEKILRLARIEVSLKLGGQCTYVEVMDADGMWRSAEYPHGQYDEREVHRFEERIRNQTLPARQDLVRREERIATLQAQIEQINARAEEELRKADEAEQELLEAQRADERLDRAEKRWREERRAWKELTGCRPRE